ncbi:hypothetical protein C491_11458 [Natronococcus amylolyticus DSM 10524]|uniref:Uncharacterized protein n=1 Tax=Natronococcus amylolyticus DSM 10524 TaxID=1227497 RepID=L9X687_9EURY|nr:hypothetical protein [Natronococcus amylolyticus]ELY57117.1 hypothetical protein C491_11458 [Natronococcus amylolyticus DSM 10524]
MTPDRRDVLKLAGATAAATVGTASTVTVTAQENGDDLPDYSRWLALADTSIEFAFLDWAALEEFVTDELEEADPDEEVPPEYEADPMIAPVSEGALGTYFYVGLDLAQYRLGGLLDEAAFDSSVEGLLRTPEAFVALGTIDPGEIDARVTAEPEAEFIRQLERTDGTGAYDVYTPVDASDAAIAVGDDALAVASETDDPIGTLEAFVGAAEGDGARATDEGEAFAWTLSSAGGADAVVGQSGPEAGDEGVVDFDYEELENSETVVSSLTVEDAETSTGEFAAVIDDPDEAALENLLGASGEDRSVDVDGDRVTATATWREEAVTGTRE